MGQAESALVKAQAAEDETMTMCPFPDLSLQIPGTSGSLEKAVSPLK